MTIFEDVHFWRQSLILLAESLHSIGIGITLTFSSVLNPALLSQSTDLRVTPDQASWMAAILGFAGMIGFCIVPSIMQRYGRKPVHMVLSFLNVVGFTIFYNAYSVTALYTAKFIQGFSICGFTLTVIILAEYSAPKRRGYFMTIKKANVGIGSLICHSLSFTWNWRQIASFSVIPFAFAFLVTCIWPESPAFLAMRGNFAECRKSHSWLFGDDGKNEENLEKLIQVQAERSGEKRRLSFVLRIKRFFIKMKRIDFLKPFAIVALLTVMVEACGRYYMLMYSIQIVIDITGNKTGALVCSIVADCCMILALCISGFVIRLFNRRTLLFSFGLLTAMLLYALSVLLCLKRNFNLDSNWPVLFLLTSISFVSNLGIIPTAFTIISEIFPLEHKGVGAFASGLIFTGLLGVTVKFIPHVIDSVGMDGMFAISGSFLVAPVILLYYTLVETKDKTLLEIEEEIKGIKRQRSLVLIGDSIHSIGTGFMLSFSSVLNPALLSPNSTDIRATPEEVSWISASLGFAGMIGFLIIPPIFQYFGRRPVHIALNSLVALGFLILYFSKSTRDLFVGKFVQGIATCGVTITAIIIAEYSHPKRRGCFMTFKKASVSLGSLICHSLYFAWSWRSIALLSVLPYTISSIIILFWPESPAYLAMKGKYEECDRSHSWMFGDSGKTKRDLEELISAQMKRKNKDKKRPMEVIRRILGKFLRRDFMKPLLIVFLVTVIIEASGRFYMLIYIIQIVKEITGNTSIAVYCSMVSDLSTMVALAISGFVVKFMTRRNIIIYFGSATTVLMYLISLLLYLKTKSNFLIDWVWLTPALIVVHTFISYVGVIPTAFTIIAEIFPLEHKGIGSFSAGVLFIGGFTVTVKLIPSMINMAGVEGLFAFFATCILLSTIALYFVLIETKDKTLQQIEDEIKGVKGRFPKLMEQTVSEKA
ncbi:unnamed protein product [Leptosia nina]|uniref:Major facilitator superfamily (MFS) profile domain-containing protein n=1 Tax=Leptosia nina TaxID=320188 RepID=A0AAV1JBS2_9NEOP